MSTTTPRVFLATPTYDRTLSVGTSDGIRHATKRYPTKAAPNADSLMDRNFNYLLALALEERDAGNATHMAMIHSDVEPEPYWIDTYMDVLAARDADLVAAVIPIKEMFGRTSTAIDHPTDPWSIERTLTMHEVMKLPETFGPEVCPGRRLLVNNGLLLLDLRRPWLDDDALCWHTENRIVRERDAAGRVVRRLVQCVSQDWLFSRKVQELGGRVLATRKVALMHRGVVGYQNNVAWGAWDFDRQYAARPLDAADRPIEVVGPADLDRILRQKPAPAPPG